MRSSSHTPLSTRKPQSNSADRQIWCVCVCSPGLAAYLAVEVGGVGGSWRCVKVKLINLVFISWHCLCLPRSHAPIKQHRRADNYPATLQTAPQAQCTRRVLGADQEAKSRLITSFTSVFTSSPAWPLQATVSIDNMRTSCRTIKTLLSSGCWACHLVFSFQTELCLHVQGDGEPMAKPKGQNDITGVSKCSTAKVCWAESKNCSSFKHCCFIFAQTFPFADCCCSFIYYNKGPVSVPCGMQTLFCTFKMSFLWRCLLIYGTIQQWDISFLPVQIHYSHLLIGRK